MTGADFAPNCFNIAPPNSSSSLVDIPAFANSRIRFNVHATASLAFFIPENSCWEVIDICGFVYCNLEIPARFQKKQVERLVIVDDKKTSPWLEFASQLFLNSTRIIDPV